MEELPQELRFVPHKDDNNFKSLQRNSRTSSNSSDTFPTRSLVDNLKDSNVFSSDDDAPRKRTMKRVKRFSDSDSDSSREKTLNGKLPSKNASPAGKLTLQSDDSESDTIVAKSLPHKSRIQNNSDSSSEESESHEAKLNNCHNHIRNKRNSLKSNFDSKKPTPTNSDDGVQHTDGSESDNAVKNEGQQLRMKNKRNKLKNKFKGLLDTRERDPAIKNDDDVNGKMDNDPSSESDEEMASIEKIKQKIKERMTSFKSSVCDPDTSDEENNQKKSIYKQKKERKTKMTSPKPQRMSAKQAMENMQKIKSESNRMLREKEVSLPYHRPKALSLKDIMSKRKLAVSSDGKALPIKMNGEQLKQYAQMLEERQREMIELCKSESEEEETNENPAEVVNGTANSQEFVKETTENVAPFVKDAEANETDTRNSLGKNEIEVNTGSPNQSNNCNEQHDLDSTENAENNVSTIQMTEEQDSETSMKLIYNDSANSVIDENLNTDFEKQDDVLETDNNDNTEYSGSAAEEIPGKGETVLKSEDSEKNSTEKESQMISLYLDTENTDRSTIQNITESTAKQNTENSTVNYNTKSVDQETTRDVEQRVNTHTATENSIENESSIQENDKSVESEGMEIENEFSDSDINMEDIDNIIENAEIIKDIEDKVNSQFLVRDKPLYLNPKLAGAPGTVIDLDDSDTAPKKSGVELLKERFIYFSKLKTPEEIERERERKIKPGTQLKQLKQELEEQIAEQRSLEWAKRLEEEKQQQKELKELRGEESDEDDIEKIEAAITEKDEIKEGSEESDSGEEEPIENDIEIKDKPRVKNAMVDDEAEESDCDENEDKGTDDGVEQNEEDNDINDDNESESDDSDESSESEEEQTVTKKGRILKAFEDSDEEDTKNQPVAEIKTAKGSEESKSGTNSIAKFSTSQIDSQDDELQLAQRLQSASDDLFTSQESILLASVAKEQGKDITESDEAFTQTFSILEYSKPHNAELDLNNSGKTIAVDATQSLDINNMDDIALCSVTDSQNLSLPSQIPTTQLTQSQTIGEDVLALCTGQFYNNQFVSQVDKPLGESQNFDAFDNFQSQDSQDERETVVNDANIGEERQTYNDTIDLKETGDFIEFNDTEDNEETGKSKNNVTAPIDQREPEDFIELNIKEKAVDDNLKSILDELADPEFDSPKPNKFFVGGTIQRDRVHTEIQMKRKLIIDSDDETNEGGTDEPKKRKKLKKKKPEKRALQISDDEEEQSEIEDVEEYESEIEEDNVDRLVEYDSEENEIEVKAKNPKKKRKMTEFFENEAELTSEDEWAGSGDEDEAGLDRMEREEGDDDTFHQGKLQRELGQIHMRDVLDQDKREVRIIQELLFEDGDLGGGGRQRKFRWNHTGDEETGTVPDEFADTQEEEFESEEQWRKQRHEREMFLRQMKTKDDPDESLNVSVNRTTIIKANLISKTMSSLLMEVKTPTTENEGPVEKKTAKDIPSPKKPFALLQQSYQGSFLSRGRGALARLAALATPLAADHEDKVGTIGPNSKRNFVFAALTPEEKGSKDSKVLKRRAETNPSTPKLVKKIRTEEQNTTKSSLLDHFKL